MRIGVAATPSVALPTLEWLLSSEHELRVVFTQPDRPAGRGRVLRESPVGQWARAHDVFLLKPESPADLLNGVEEIDVVITIGYGVILPISVLTIPRFGFINLHFSLLPAWRGAAPVARAILGGDLISGVTVFQLDAGMDTGPIYVSKMVPISPAENTGEVLQHMAAIGPSVIKEALDLISQQIPPVRQSMDGVSYAGKISKMDARLNWNKNAETLNREIRAFTPEPGAWTLWRGQPLQISKAQITSHNIHLTPGEISAMDGSVFVGCGVDEWIRIERLTPAGKKEMGASEWLNGSRLKVGEHFV